MDVDVASDGEDDTLTNIDADSLPGAGSEQTAKPASIVVQPSAQAPSPSHKRKHATLATQPNKCKMARSACLT